MKKTDEKIYEFIENLNDVFTNEELKIIKESYEKIKFNVVESLYPDVASTCVTSILLRKQLGKEISCDAIMEDLPKLLKIDSDDVVMSLRDIKGKDAVYNPLNNTFGEIIENLKCSNDLANAVFLDILNGEDIKLITKKYRLTKEEVDNIYTERLAHIETILVVDNDIVNKEIDAREPHKSNVKILTDSNR